MAGDLEDFLRRAAQRRQQKAAAEKQQAAQTPRREQPQYSDSRTERIARPVDLDEPILAAEVIDVSNESHARRIEQIEVAKRDAVHAKRKADRATRDRTQQEAKAKKSAITRTLTGNPTADLINLIRQSGGIQQAILLREIFDRPEHRW